MRGGRRRACRPCDLVHPPGNRAVDIVLARQLKGAKGACTWVASLVLPPLHSSLPWLQLPVQMMPNMNKMMRNHNKLAKMPKNDRGPAAIIVLCTIA